LTRLRGRRHTARGRRRRAQRLQSRQRCAQAFAGGCLAQGGDLFGRGAVLFRLAQLCLQQGFALQVVLD
jgi:hypothetical protein